MEELDAIIEEDSISVKVMVLVVYDGSGSMAENGTSGSPKFKEAEEATNGFISRLIDSKIANSFDLGVAVFNTKVTEVLAPTPVQDLPTENAIELPLPRGSTNIDAGLEWAEAEARNFMDQSDELDASSKKVAIIVLSDGHHNHGPNPEKRGQMLANQYTLGACGYGNAAEETLKGIVSNPSLFKKDPTPDDLRGLIELSSTYALSA